MRRGAHRRTWPGALRAALALVLSLFLISALPGAMAAAAAAPGPCAAMAGHAGHHQPSHPAPMCAACCVGFAAIEPTANAATGAASVAPAPILAAPTITPDGRSPAPERRPPRVPA